MLIQKRKDLSDYIFNLYELFLVFICANNNGSVVNNFFEVKIFDEFR